MRSFVARFAEEALVFAEMKGILLLADSATAHPDGTVSMLRMGITRLWVQPKTPGPFAFRGSLIARITGDLGDAGQHNFDLKCLDEDGEEVAPAIAGSVNLAKEGGEANLIVNMAVALPRIGKYVFVIRVDNFQLDSYDFRVSELSH